MIKLSANYSYTNHNFVIQNLTGERIGNEYLAGICIVKNIIQRGKPTLLTTFLQDKLGVLHERDDFKKAHPLISQSEPKWTRVIRGDEKGNYFPAKQFYETIIAKHLPDYKFIQQLILPEVPINEITQVDSDEFKDQQVDFYLPQAYLIIEIDGSQHKIATSKDKARDAYAKKYGIETVRISTSEISSESDSLKDKLKNISKKIDRISDKQLKRKQSCSVTTCFNDYRSAFQNGVDLTNPNYKATAVIRFQLLILSLLEYGIFDIQGKWLIQLLERDVKDFALIAIEDLVLWFTHIYKLHKLPFKKPEISLTVVKSSDDFNTSGESINVDFSLLKRYTDEFQTESDVIFVRGDYFDEYLYFKKGDSRDKLHFSSFEPYDYFSMSTTASIKYSLKFGGNDSDVDALKYFLWNIFLQTDKSLSYESLTFREGQLPIISNALSREDTIGLLPTGSGKSICYQLVAILQPSISFVVCPIKSLMYDQKADLDINFFDRTNLITSDDDAEDKEKVQREFARGKYFFIFISPERFQIDSFRQYIGSVSKNFNIAYAVIDEAHCLSEWGHDFRTSYLNLSKTIQRICSNFNFLGLTATASLNVLKDLQVEFGIESSNVKTTLNYTREELEFSVIDDLNDKQAAIVSIFKRLNKSLGNIEKTGYQAKCGIIFTPTVNGAKGCYKLSQLLSKELNMDVRYFSGKKPDKLPEGKQRSFERDKMTTQNDFKQNRFPLLTATKAFGMGVNKGNIYYTIHYGIPGSMEALYQEAGRAGRDKKKFIENKAQCFVLLSRSKNNDALGKVWKQSTALPEVVALNKKIQGDINTNLFLFQIGLEEVEKEFAFVRKLHKFFCQPKVNRIQVRGSTIGANKSTSEKAIYRLSQLGIIKDWTITSFFGGGEFIVECSDYSDESIRLSLLKTIRKYKPDFTFESIVNDSAYKLVDTDSVFEKSLRVLLQWSYNNFAYNRRQSLKNVYENCCAAADGDISSDELKIRLENYFKFTEASHVLQYIAENPRDYKKWFSVFYKDHKSDSADQLITGHSLSGLRENLSRFLESHMDNSGLDLISGLLRLLLDDYENADGRQRLDSALVSVQNMQKAEKDFIISETIKIGRTLPLCQRNLLGKSLADAFSSRQYHMLISKELKDHYSATKFLVEANQRLKQLNKRIYVRLRKVG